MINKIKNSVTTIINEIKNGGGNTVGASCYIPLVGWAYPYIAKKKDDLIVFHRLQALHLNAVILVIYLAIWLLENFPIISIFFGGNSFLSPITQTVWLVSLFTYVALSGIAAYHAYSSKVWHVPYLGMLVEKTIQYFKNLQGKS